MATSTKSTEWLEETSGRLAVTRNALGLSQTELSEALNISRAALANWETCTRFPDIGAMTRMCDRFGITLDWIYRGDISGLPMSLAEKIMKARRGELSAAD